MTLRPEIHKFLQANGWQPAFKGMVPFKVDWEPGYAKVYEARPGNRDFVVTSGVHWRTPWIKKCRFYAAQALNACRVWRSSINDHRVYRNNYERAFKHARDFRLQGERTQR